MSDNFLHVPGIIIEDNKDLENNIDSEDEYIEEIDNTDWHYEVNKRERITKPFMNKYEKAKVLGTRAMQISRNAPIFVKLQAQDSDPLLIAEKELRERKIPFVIRRHLPDGKYEDWEVSELDYE